MNRESTDKIVHSLSEQVGSGKLVTAVYNKAIHEQREYQQESALFICNKWDLVS